MTRRSRSEKVSIGFLIVWMTFWASAILVAVWNMGDAALSGEPAPAIFLLVWLVAAGFGLLSAGRRLKRLLLKEKAPPPQPRRGHSWNDGLDPPPPPRDPAP